MVADDDSTNLDPLLIGVIAGSLFVVVVLGLLVMFLLKARRKSNTAAIAWDNDRKVYDVEPSTYSSSALTINELDADGMQSSRQASNQYDAAPCAPATQTGAGQYAPF